MILTDWYGCTDTSSRTLSVEALPIPDLGPDDKICEGDSILLAPSQAYDSYLWSTGEIDSAIWVTSIGTYSLMVSTENGCEGADTITITRKSIKDCRAVGIEGLWEASFDIYPNPSSGQVHIHSSEAIIGFIRLYDLQGQQVEADISHDRHIGRIQTAFQGIGIVQIHTNQGMLYQKLLFE